MESAKINAQILQLNSENSYQGNANEPKAIFAVRKAPANEIENAPDADPKPSLNEKQEAGKEVDKTQLINKLNFINFQDGTVLINFNHLKYDKKISLRAAPQPCMGDFVDCLWSADANYTSQITRSYEFSSLLVTNGQKLLQVDAKLAKIDEKGISLFYRKRVMKPVPAEAGAIAVKV